MFRPANGVAGVGGTSGLVPSGDPTMAVVGLGLGSDTGWHTEVVSSTIYFDGGGGGESVTFKISFYYVVNTNP